MRLAVCMLLTALHASGTGIVSNSKTCAFDAHQFR